MAIPLPPPPRQGDTLPLHRCSFFAHTPTPITAIAFPPTPLPAPGPSSAPSEASPREEHGDCVIAREGGEVEIWRWCREDAREGGRATAGGEGNWALLKVLPPTLTHPTISHMALVLRSPSTAPATPQLADLRLFTASSTSPDIAERCLLTGRVLNLYPIPSPPLWSMSVSPTHSLLCLATTSPTLHFLSIPESSSVDPSPPLGPPPPHLFRSETLPGRCRTVSIAWGPPKAVKAEEAGDQWEWRDTYLVTGNSDSSWRRWDIQEGSVTNGRSGRLAMRGRAVMEKVQKPGRGGQKPGGGANQKGTIVWGIAALPDGTVVTSDSLGTVTFWDGATFAQKQTFRAQKADGMCLTVGPDGQTIFTSGPDQRLTQFSYLPSSSTWLQTSQRRLHTHDVRSLAIFPPYTPLPASHRRTAPSSSASTAPIIVSGGWDMCPVFSPAAAPGLTSGDLRVGLRKLGEKGKGTFEEGASKRGSCLGGGRGTGRVEVSRAGRLVCGRGERGVEVWRLGGDKDEGDEGWSKVLDMSFNLRTSLITSTISDDGKWLAVSDLYETKLFRLEADPDGSLVPHRIRSFLPTLASSSRLAHLSIPTQGCGASSLLFTPDSQRLILGLVHSGDVVVLELPSASPASANANVKVVKCFPAVRADGVRVLAGKAVPKQRAGGGKQDVRMSNGHGEVGKSESGEEEEDGGDEEEDEEEEDERIGSAAATRGEWVAMLAVSGDLQWLAAGDLAGRVAVYNLDTLQLHAHLPTLPTPPTSLAFPPSHPSLLLILSPTNTLQVYHTEHRRFLRSSPQLALLNRRLLAQAQSSPALGMAVEPGRDRPRSTRMVVWGSEWVVSAKVDFVWLARGSGLVEGYGGAANGKGNKRRRRRVGPDEDGDGDEDMSAEEEDEEDDEEKEEPEENEEEEEEEEEGDSVSQVSKRLVRKRRARQARKQLEALSLSASASPSVVSSSTAPAPVHTPAHKPPPPSSHSAPESSLADKADFVKVVHGRFRGIAGVDWIVGHGKAKGKKGKKSKVDHGAELVVVERRVEDMREGVPDAFEVARYGRS